MAISPTKRAPATQETIIFQLATPVQISSTAPSRMAIVEVSPIEPGIFPINICKKSGVAILEVA